MTPAQHGGLAVHHADSSLDYLDFGEETSRERGRSDRLYGSALISERVAVSGVRP